MGALRAQLQERLEGVEGDVRQTVEQLDLHAQVRRGQGRRCSLLLALDGGMTLLMLGKCW